MTPFTAIDIIVAIFNLLNTASNFFWSNRLKGIQEKHEVLNGLRESCQDKDIIIKDIKRKNTQLKSQYSSLLLRYTEMEGTLKTYQQFNKHDSVK